MPRAPGVRFNLPFLHGLYVAFNAIPDAYFLGDGPSCVFAKAEHIHGRHDLFSTILSCGSDHRVQYTGVNVFTIAGNFESQIFAALKRIAAWPDCGVVFTGAMPMCSIAGSDYERILREALDGCGKPSFLIPRRSAVTGDWLDGYAGALEVVASGMDLAGAKAEPGAVALVGHLMDRNEGDQLANVAELERMTRALGAEPVSVWLSGRPYAHLREVRRAETIVSLPYGRKAARVLAKRLGARLVEADLPFGLEASRRFMEALGRGLGREEAARAFVRTELDEVAPRLEWSVPHVFENRRFAFAGDPHHAAGFAELVEELGGRMVSTTVMGGAGHLSAERRAFLQARPGTLFEPDRARLRRLFAEATGGEADLLVCNSLGVRYINPSVPWIELGFPSEHAHFLHDEPFLGFQGALAFLSRAANELAKGLRLKEAA
jgi:nitrogenase molybdenum-iron protein alpha/beta subunit